MKTFSILNENKKQKLNVQENSMNYVSDKDLKKYLDIANKFLSNEGKDIINYLIINNKTYISELGTDTEENALAGFYNAGEPTDKNLKELYNALNVLVKDGRYLEIPVFQTKEQFDKIINQEVSPDYIILNIESPQAQNELSKKFQPLIHKICRQYHGKSNFSYEDLMSAANEGFVYALNSFGKKKNVDDQIDDNIVKYTFLQYAAQMIRFSILDAINNTSRTVRIAKSQITKTRKEQGQIAKNNTVSGDKQIGIHNSDEGNKTMFDFIDSQEYSDTSMNRADLDKLWGEIYKEIKKEFGEKVFNVWCSFYGINDYEKLKNKELAKKYNVSNSLITYYCMKVNTFLQKDKKVFAMLKDVYELMKECLNEEDRNNHDYETYHISHAQSSIED